MVTVKKIPGGTALVVNRHRIKTFGLAHRKAAETESLLRDDPEWTKFYDAEHKRFVAKRSNRDRYAALMESGQLKPSPGYYFNTITKRLVKADAITTKTGALRASLKQYELDNGLIKLKKKRMVTIEIELWAANESARNPTMIEGKPYSYTGEPIPMTVPDWVLEGTPINQFVAVNAGGLDKLLRNLRNKKAFSATSPNRLVTVLESIKQELESRVDFARILVRGEVAANPKVALKDIPAGFGDMLWANSHMGARIVTADGDLRFVPSADDEAILTVPRKPNDCTERAIVQTFGASWNAFYKKEVSKLTIDSVAAATGPLSDFKRTCQQLLDGFFKPNRLGFTVYDITGRIVMHWMPEMDGLSRNKRIHPCHGYFTLHNDHMLPMLEDTKSLGGSLSLQKHHDDDDMETPPDRFPKVQFDPSQYHQCPTFESLQALIREHKDASDSILHVHYNESLALLNYDLRKLGHEPAIQVYNNQIVRLTVRNPGIPTIIISRFPVQLDEPLEGIPADAYATFIDGLSKLVNTMLSGEYRSTYSSSLQAAFQHYGRGPLNRRFEKQAPTRSIGVDVVRAYTSILCGLEYIPVFIEGDVFEPYDGHAIEPYTLYQVKNIRSTVESWFVADKEVSMMSGMTLKECGVPVQVLAFCRPANLERNRIGSVIQDIYEGSLPDSLKKWVVNCVIGLAGKRTNRKQDGVFTTDLKEAYNFCRGDSVPMHCVGGYLPVNSSATVLLKDGFMPIQSKDRHSLTTSALPAWSSCAYLVMS